MKIIYDIFCLMFFISFFPFSVTYAKNFYTGKENVSVIRIVETKNSFIMYVTIDGLPYIVKQKKNAAGQFSIVRDALAAYIAQDLSIAHSVQIIYDFPGKIHALYPAALLTIAPGATILSQRDSKYYRLCLKQRTINNALLSDRWLTEKIIDQITWHEQLPIIIGLDLFLCNTDRHGGNLFYDPLTDNFCAIDMDNIFRRDLPALACDKLTIMIEDRKRFTHKEIKALISVRDTIQFLLDKYSADHLIEQLHLFVKQAGFQKGSLMHTKKIAKKIALHEEIIRESRKSSYRLIKLLNKIINGM